MLVYEKKKQQIQNDNMRRINPGYVPPTPLPTGNSPKNQSGPLSGLAGTPIKPVQKVPEHEKSSFFKQKKALRQSDPVFNDGMNMIEQVASQLGEQVKRGHMPKAIAEKKLRQALDDFAKEQRGMNMAKARQEKMQQEQNAKNKEAINTQGKELANQVTMAREGDKDAQRSLRDIKFDWTKPQAEAVVQGFSGETEEEM